MILALAAWVSVLAEPAWPAHYQEAATAWEAGRKDEALTKFYIGQLRGRINVSCVEQEPSGGPALLGALQEVMGTPINGWAGGDVDRWMKGIDAALLWDASHPDPDVTTDACRIEQAKQRQGLRDLRASIDRDRAEIARQRKANGLDK